MKNKNPSKNEMINRLASEYIYNMDRQEKLDYAIKSMARDLSGMKLRELKELYVETFEDID